MKKVKDISLEYQTPDNVCEYMVSLLGDNVRFVLEPTPGIGNLVKALKLNGFSVDSPKDYFVDRDRILRTDYDAIVCNLPYSQASAILDNAPFNFKNKAGMKFFYKLLFEMIGNCDRVVALVPWFTLIDSDVRIRYLKSYGLRSITGLPRSTFKYTRIQTCVLDLDKSYDGETDFKVFDLIGNTKHNVKKLNL